jgi:hypothetical protein
MRVVAQVDFESIGPLFFLQEPDCSSERVLVCTLTRLRGDAKVVVIDMLRNGEVVAEAGTRGGGGGVHFVRVDKRGIIHCLVRGADGENVVHRFELVQR